MSWFVAVYGLAILDFSGSCALQCCFGSNPLSVLPPTAIMATITDVALAFPVNKSCASFRCEISSSIAILPGAYS